MESPNVMPKFDPNKGLEFGLYSLGDFVPDYRTKRQVSAQQRLEEIVEIAKYAEDAGFDMFAVGESHQPYFVSQAHLIILAAIAAETKNIKLSSAVTTISVLDPVRVFESAATIDLLSNERMEIIAGRASRLGAYKLFGYDTADYDRLFEEKFDLLLDINRNERLTWQGQFRPPLEDVSIIPRPASESGGLPIWRGVGNTRLSAQKAGQAGLPLSQAHLAGATQTYQGRIKLYRQAAAEAGFDPDSLPVQTAGFFYVRPTTQEAFRTLYPHINESFKLTNGTGFSKRAFAQGKSPKSVVNVGEPSLVIEKILYQHELFGHQRYLAQIDYGGMTLDDAKQTIDIIGEQIIPVIKKYTRKKGKK